MLRIQLAPGEDYTDVLDSFNRDGSTPTTFMATDTLTAKLWDGQSDTTLFSPAVSWTGGDYTTGKFAFTIANAQSALLTSNATYRCQVFATRSSLTYRIADFLVFATVTPGAATETTLTYGSYQDMLNVAGWCVDVQDVDANQGGFYQQRLDARNWMDWAIANSYRGAFVGLFEMHSYAAFAFGYAGWRRSLGPSPSLLTYLSQNLLIVRPQVVKACAHYALGQLGLAQMGQNPSFVAHGHYHMAMADKLAISITAEVDLNNDGVGELFINLGSTNTLAS